jgi:bifunctional DNA-binding transcriptional regulator/antitoxin component of YhaV-PrlF toxin-antitoxin module
MNPKICHTHFEAQMATETVTMGADGSIELPEAILKEFALCTGERLTIFSEDGVIKILSSKMALESIRADIIQQRGSLAGLLDEFLEERHKEAKREQDENV